MTRDKATAFVTRYAQAWNQRDVACLTAFYDGNAVVLSAVFGELRGRYSIQGSYEKLFAALLSSSFKSTHRRSS
jgi:ketosteroid isomerase-like protein